jgi:NAD(P)-dependent dehydrogenase (short-subunit alcohol dehydrogenase family)
MDRLSGRVAIVTGAGMGIGRGIARKYAREGASVVVAEIREPEGARTVEELEQLGARALLVPTDVGQKDQVTHMVNETVASFGRVDILVNNAQGFTPLVALEDKTDEMLDFALGTGLWATFWSMQAVFPPMRDQGGGRIINFCSLNGVQGGWYTADYNAAKEGFQGLTRSAAREWGRYQILVNAIAPGAASEGWLAYKNANPREAAGLESSIPLGRMGDTEEDIGGVALFLASDDGRYMTGHTLFVDGGGHLGGGWRPPRSTRPDGTGHFLPDSAPDDA